MVGPIPTAATNVWPEYVERPKMTDVAVWGSRPGNSCGITTQSVPPG